MKPKCHPRKVHYGKGLCKRCYQKAWIKKHPHYHRDWKIAHYQYDPVKRRETGLQKKYGISVKTYERIFRSQEGKCAICQGTPDGRWRRFMVDHDHATGVVRDLLCVRCNRAVGLLKDKIQIAERMVRYLYKGVKIMRQGRTVKHCHGKSAGKVIKTHRTVAKAKAQHRAIMAKKKS